MQMAVYNQRAMELATLLVVSYFSFSVSMSALAANADHLRALKSLLDEGIIDEEEGEFDAAQGAHGAGLTLLALHHGHRRGLSGPLR